DAEHRGPVRGEERGRLREEAGHPARGERIAPTDALLRARERGRARGGRGHLIPELAKPCTKYRGKIRNRRIIGTAAIVVPAMSRCQSVDASSRNEESPTWITRRVSAVVTSSGHRKLFHPCSKLSSATVSSPGLISGVMIRASIPSSLTPSMRAASISSVGVET